jgi:hypothetical protein
MRKDLSDEVLQFCDKELEHLRVEQEFALYELSEYRDEKLKEAEADKVDTV